MLSECTSALRSAGWTVHGGGGGGSGVYGGGGLGATKGAANLQVQAGTNGATTTIQVCTWPGPQSNDGCGNGQNNQNQNQQNQNQQNQNQQNQNQQNENQNNQNGN